MLSMYNSIFGSALLWDQTTTSISRWDEYSIMLLCYVNQQKRNDQKALKHKEINTQIKERQRNEKING